MRDPKRIAPTLKAIKKIWLEHPELRLMQLLLNTKAGYYTEDDVLIERLRQLYESGQGENFEEAMQSLSKTDTIEGFFGKIKNQKDMPPKYAKLVSKNFWDLI